MVCSKEKGVDVAQQKADVLSVRMFGIVPGASGPSVP